MDLAPTQRDLLATERWAWLGAHLQRWYAAPLSAGDGEAPEAITAAERRVGVAFPEALVEWFLLVGRRLRAVQDAPLALDAVAAEEGGLAFWQENQGVWTLAATPAGDTAIDDASFAWAEPPLVAALAGMLASDLIVGAWSGRGHGPLGRLADGVVGGVIADGEPALVAGYPDLGLSANPFFSVGVRGDAATLLRCDPAGGMGLEWAAATPDAVAALDRVVPLDPPGGVHVVAVAFEGLDPDLLGLVTDARGIPDAARVAPWLGAAAGLSTARASRPTPTTPGSAVFEYETTEPDALVARLASGIEGPLRAHLTVARRPERVGTFTRVFPDPGRRWP